MIWEVIGDILRISVLGGLGAAGILAILIWKRNKTVRVTYIRLVIQAVAFAAIFYIFSYTFPLIYALIAIFAMTIVLGRLFCGWFCPFGFVMDLIVLLRKALKIRYINFSDKLNMILHQSRYVILLFFLLVPAILWYIAPLPNINFAFDLAQILGGPFHPYTVLIDPLTPLIVPYAGPLVVSHINFSYPYVHDIFNYSGQNLGEIIAIAFVGLTLVGSFFVRRVWCRFCPTGASFGVMNRFKGFNWAPLLHLDKDEEKCTKCGVCKRVCQSQVPDVYEQKGGRINTSMCMLCLRCAEMCPYEDALKLKLGSKTVFKSRNWLEPSTCE